MRFIIAMLTLLAVMADTGSAEEATISGTVTLKFEPRAAPPARALTVEQRKLRECAARWNQKLAASRKDRAEASMRRARPMTPGTVPQALTRADYRKCMYACLTDAPTGC